MQGHYRKVSACNKRVLCDLKLDSANYIRAIISSMSRNRSVTLAAIAGGILKE